MPKDMFHLNTDDDGTIPLTRRLGVAPRTLCTLRQKGAQFVADINQKKLYSSNGRAGLPLSREQIANSSHKAKSVVIITPTAKFQTLIN